MSVGVGRLYRPANFLKFTIRLEDWVEPVAEDDEAQSEIEPYKEQKKEFADEVAKLQAQLVRENAALASGASSSTAKRDNLAERISLQEDFAKLAIEKSEAQQEIDDETSVEFFVVPTSLDIECNGFRQADTLRASFPFRDCPLDPRIVRECQVEAFLGTVTAEDFASPDNWVLPFKRSVFRFKGFVDTWDAPHSEEDSTISINCRSYEAVLIDGKISALAPAYKPKSEEEKISTYVNRILSQFPPTSGAHGNFFKAIWNGDPTKEPLLNRRTLIRSLQSPSARNKGLPGNSGTGEGQKPTEKDPQVVAAEDTNKPADDRGTDAGSAPSGAPGIGTKGMKEEGMSVWDLLTQACELAGCIPLYDPSLPPLKFEGNDILAADCLILSPVQSLYDSPSGVSVKGGSWDGFTRDYTDRNTGDVQRADIRIMVWGNNIKSVKFGRKLGRIRCNAVEVRAYNPDAPPKDRVLSARFPLNNRATRVAAKAQKKAGVKKGKGAKGKLDLVRTFVICGVRDKLMLEQIAVNLYHQLARQELTVDIETDEMASYIDHSIETNKQYNDDPDLLHLTPGSPVKVIVADANNTGNELVLSTLSEVFDARGSKIANLIRNQGGRFGHLGLSQDSLELVATKIQKAMEAAKLPNVFYCRTITHSFSEEGYTAKMQLVNYMVTRADPNTMSDATIKMQNARVIKIKKYERHVKAATGKEALQVIDDMAINRIATEQNDS